MDICDSKGGVIAGKTISLFGVRSEVAAAKDQFIHGFNANAGAR